MGLTTSDVSGLDGIFLGGGLRLQGSRVRAREARVRGAPTSHRKTRVEATFLRTGHREGLGLIGFRV